MDKGTHMPNMNAQSFTVRKYGHYSKVGQRSRSRSHFQNFWYCLKCLVTRNTHTQYKSPISQFKKVTANDKVFQKKVKGHGQGHMQSSKDSTSPMSETCKIRTGQVKFQDHKPDWACKIVKSKLKKYWTKQTRIPFL